MTLTHNLNEEMSGVIVRETSGPTGQTGSKKRALMKENLSLQRLFVFLNLGNAHPQTRKVMSVIRLRL